MPEVVCPRCGLKIKTGPLIDLDTGRASDRIKVGRYIGSCPRCGAMIIPEELFE